MTDYAIGGLQSPADGDCIDLKPRDVRALTECMTTVPLGGDIYSVITESGREWTVDRREDRCTCPDHELREATCKHIRRVKYATGERDIPSWVSFAAVDPLLGEHVDGRATTDSETTAIADGGTTDDDECNDCVTSSEGALVAPCFHCYRDGVASPDE